MGVLLHSERGDRGFSGYHNLLMAPVLLWLMENQPDAINNPELCEKLFVFDVDILRNDVCDISLNLQLTERVRVSTDRGMSSVEAVPEPGVPEVMWTMKHGRSAEGRGLAGGVAGESGACRAQPYDASVGAGIAPQSAAEYQAAAKPGRERLRAAPSNGPQQKGPY